MNEELRTLYLSTFNKMMDVASLAHGVEMPHLLKASPGYEQASVKLMIVGQQTWHWPVHDRLRGRNPRQMGVNDLMAEYMGFFDEVPSRTAFWQAADGLYRVLNPQAAHRGFLWNNLVKVAQDGKRPEPQVEEAICKLDLVPREIAITKPKVVVFFAGGHWERLINTFPGVVCRPTAVYAVNQLEHPKLPACTFQTYHPQYLRRHKSRLGDVVGELGKLLVQCASA